MQPRAIVPENGVRTGRNRSGSAIATRTLVKLAGADGVDCVETFAAAADHLYGVAMQGIADGANGDVQIRGKALCVAGAAVSAGDLLQGTTAGKVILFAASAGDTDTVVGQAITAAAADGDVLEVELAGPSVSRQTED